MCEAGYAEERDEETDEDETKEPEAEPFPREHEGRGVSRVVSQMENLDITQVRDVYRNGLILSMDWMAIALRLEGDCVSVRCHTSCQVRSPVS